MSHVAKAPVNIPPGITVQINGQMILLTGKNGELMRTINKAIEVKYVNHQIHFILRHSYVNGYALIGTTRAIINSMVIGITHGFTKTLQLVGVGYRVTITDNIAHLSLGFSHLINYQIPRGIIAECLSQTEIMLKSADKQLIGQVAAELCAYRRPEPYKGKGIRDTDKIVLLKEAKKK